MGDRKQSSGKGYLLAGSLAFMAVAVAIYSFFYQMAELRCSKAENTCSIVRTTPLRESRISFPLRSITGAEKTAFSISRGSQSRARHIALQTTDGDRHLTDYDTGIGVEMMDKNVKAIKAFIVGKESQNLTIRQDDRIIALAALPFVGFSILFLFLWYWMRKKSKEYPSTTA